MRLKLLLALLLTLTAIAATACDDDAPQAAAPRGTPVLSGNGGPGAGTPVVRAGRTAPRRAQPFDPASFQLVLEPVASGLNRPLFVTSAPDGSGRLFVVEQGGTVRIIQGGALLPEIFLDIRDRVRAGGEQGLLGLVFHPRYAENGRLFVNYTAHNSDNTIAEFHVSADPNRAGAAGGRVLLALPDFAANHNAGMLAFGPDGFLYVGTGDGGGGGDPQRTAQNAMALLGKMLRLDVDSGEPYAIAAGNPFAGRSDIRPEIWATGLRNPWRYSFDRITGDLWIADVGQGEWEEINLQPAGSAGGENYGWSIMEGTHCFRPSSGCDQNGLVRPVHEYDHSLGCSVTGGYVYRGAAYPALEGAYLFGDYCSGRIWALSPDTGAGRTATELLKASFQISSFGEDEQGEMYLTGYNTGIVYRLTTVAR